jgi:aldose 1-epimerase
VTVQCELPAQPGYPWPLLLRTEWRIGADGLRATHEAGNLGRTPAPFGLGVHPYLRLPGVRVDDLRLRVPARSRLLLDGRLLPIGAAKVAGSEYDFRTPRRIGTAMLDTAFGDLEVEPSGGSSVTLAGPEGSTVSVWADPAFGWWQVFSGDTLTGERHRRSVAVEAMTCPPDAFRSGRDMIVLEPGQSWQAGWGIRPGH